MSENVTLGKQIDEIYSLDCEIGQAEAEVKKLKQRRAGLEKELIEDFGKSELEGAQGGYAKAKLVSKDHPQIKDRDALMAYVKEHDAFDLYYQRISSTAWKARIEAGETVPGIEAFTSITVKASKL